MIIVSYTAQGGRLRLSVAGHAGADEPGRDTVCASASILAYTVAHIVKNAWAANELCAKPVIKMKPGDAVIECSPYKSAMKEIVYVYYAVFVGLSLLARDYPEYVKIVK